MEVLYTIDFGLYTGTGLTACNYRNIYKVTGKGVFEFVSSEPIEEKE